MMNDRTVLIVIGILIVVLMGSILYVTHQPTMAQPAFTAATTTSATSTATIATTTPSQLSVGSKAAQKVEPGSAYYEAPSNNTSRATVPATAPRIIKFLPAGGTPGTSVTIFGSGFSSTSNHIFFGSSTGRYHADGTPANEIATVASTNGTTITFIVPTSGPSGLLCDTSGCIAVSATAITSGEYPVYVSNAAGTSNIVSYIVIK